MNNELLGTQIAKYRKAAGITQEELGRAVGVSTQAVSRWECGGAPDVSLLPAIADRLGVTIGALFGREEGAAGDMYESLHNWLSAIPQEKRMKEFYRLLSITPDLLNGTFSDGPYAPEEKRLVSSSAYTAEGHLMREVFDMEEGLLLAVRAEDCPFYLMMPEPPGGYESNLFSAEEYRAFFELLGRPGTLEILLFFHRRAYRPSTALALAHYMGMEPEEMAPLLEDMAKGNLLDGQEIETERGAEQVYSLRGTRGLIPLLFLARWTMDPSDSWRNLWCSRTHPMLRRVETAEEGK